MQNTIDSGASTEKIAEQVLRKQLRISGKLSGLRFTAYAVSEILEDYTRIRHITKDLYPGIAKHFHVRPTNVERSIRTVVTACWEDKQGRKALEEMVGFHLTKRPTNSEFLDIVASYIRFEL